MEIYNFLLADFSLEVNMFSLFYVVWEKDRMPILVLSFAILPKNMWKLSYLAEEKPAVFVWN